MRRAAVGVAVASGVSLVFGGVALACAPRTGSYLLSGVLPCGRGSPLIDDNMTVAREPALVHRLCSVWPLSMLKRS